MRERFIRISHAMRIFFLLYGVAAIVRRVQQFCREPISHCFFATSAGIENNPTDCEGAAAFLMNFNRNLIGGSSYAARLHRSEEHTSELQSQSNLVCRLL